MTGRLRVAVVYGGRSGEHEVSVESARSVLAQLNGDRYHALPVLIAQEGSWRLAAPDGSGSACEGEQRILPSADPQAPTLLSLAVDVPSVGGVGDVDVVFPLVHGTFGEDGCLQGLFELAQVPYVGSGVGASAVGMDKILMKAVFRAHGLPVPDYVAIDRSAFEREPSQVIERIRAEVGLPCFVKPANLGSSVGISKARDEEQLMRALVEAAGYSARLIVERALLVREIECGVLGNDELAASEVGEVMPAREFYDYEAKYRDPATRFEIPARVDAATRGRVQELALAAFRAVGASGMARVDFFLDRGSGAIYLNEINTIPGFTAMSVYPRLWAASGVGYPDLIDRLIALALQRHADQARNRTRYD